MHPLDDAGRLVHDARALVGAGSGDWFSRYFRKAGRPVALGQVTHASWHVFYWAYGAGVGVVFFLWGLFGMMLGRMQKAAKSAAKP